jgi:hypothetical protein
MMSQSRSDLSMSFEAVIESVKTCRSDNSLIITLSLGEDAIPQAALAMIAAKDAIPLWCELTDQLPEEGPRSRWSNR